MRPIASGTASRGHARHTALRRIAGAVVLGLVVLLCAGVTAAGAAPALQFNSFSEEALNADGVTPATQAGAHPYELKNAFELASVVDSRVELEVPVAAIKDTVFELPPGFVGDPSAMPKCSQEDIDSLTVGCPTNTQVGYAITKLNFIFGRTASPSAIYNMVPPPGMPAQFAFVVVNKVVHIDLSIRSGGDYGVTATVSNINAATPVFGATIHLWGVPADEAHDALRFLPHRETAGDLSGNPIPSHLPRKPLLRNPTSCMGPLTTALAATSWEEPDEVVNLSATAAGVTGCSEVPFSPSFTLAPDVRQGGAPSGYSFDLRLTQNENPDNLAEADLKDATVTLPAGVALSPSAATGLVGCAAEGPEGIGLHAPEVEIEYAIREPRGNCPDASKIGSVEVETPLLAKPLKGAVFVAQPKCGGAGQPACTEASASDGELFGLYLEAAGSGVVVKLAGEAHVDPASGQITAVFKNNPQLPFSELRLSLDGGPQAALANPAACGSYRTTSDLVPWSAPFAPDATPSSTFPIDQGCGALGFAPAFTAGTTSNQAGAFSPFTLTFSRGDGEQDFKDVQQTLPAGLLAKLAGVPVCSDTDATAGSCPEATRIGSVNVGAGPGPAPFYAAGKIFLTGPYKGGPYGVAVQVPAVAGPFNLGMVVVRGSIHIDPHTTQATVVSDPFPTVLDGIPLRIKTVNVTLDRPAFTFNPTSCAHMAVTGAFSSTQGASAPVSSPFQAVNCASLAFKPTFTVSTSGKTRKATGASLKVRVTFPKAGGANIHSVHVVLPKALPSRLSTLQKACPDAVFDANPATCPAGSIVGHAKASTPVLSAPLEGPAYFVSHGGAKFPELVMILQGSGITIELNGETLIRKGITSTTFRTVPDAPITSFELILPQQANSALAANVKLCNQKLVMPTELGAQNGAQVKQNTKINVEGCPEHKHPASQRKTS